MTANTPEQALDMIREGLEYFGAHMPGYGECLRGYETMRYWHEKHGEPKRRPSPLEVKHDE